jgi:hypothetical protein
VTLAVWLTIINWDYAVALYGYALCIMCSQKLDIKFCVQLVKSPNETHEVFSKCREDVEGDPHSGLQEVMIKCANYLQEAIT